MNIFLKTKIVGVVLALTFMLGYLPSQSLAGFKIARIPIPGVPANCLDSEGLLSQNKECTQYAGTVTDFYKANPSGTGGAVAGKEETTKPAGTPIPGKEESTKNKVSGGNNLSYELKNPLAFKSLQDFIVAILNIVIVIATPIVVIFIILAGFKYVTARGNATSVQEATRALTYAIIGGVLIIGAVAIAEIIKNLVTAFS